MITASQLQDIVDAFSNNTEFILIEGDLMERSTGRYLLHKDGEVYRVKGIAWGHGHLFIYTEEKGTTGISYEHEVIDCACTDDDEEEGCRQMVLEDFA